MHTYTYSRIQVNVLLVCHSSALFSGVPQQYLIFWCGTAVPYCLVWHSCATGLTFWCGTAVPYFLVWHSCATGLTFWCATAVHWSYILVWHSVISISMHISIYWLHHCFVCTVSGNIKCIQCKFLHLVMEIALNVVMIKLEHVSKGQI